MRSSFASPRCFKQFYGWGLITLGAWEAVAFATRGRVPTVSRTTKGHRRRQAALLVWMCGAAVHVLRR